MADSTGPSNRVLVALALLGVAVTTFKGYLGSDEAQKQDEFRQQERERWKRQDEQHREIRAMLEQKK